MPRRPLSPNSRSDDWVSNSLRKLIKKSLGANPGLHTKNTQSLAPGEAGHKGNKT